MLGPSLATYVRSSRALKKYVAVAHWYADLMGYGKWISNITTSMCVFMVNSGHLIYAEVKQVKRASSLLVLCGIILGMNWNHRHLVV